MFCIIKNLEIPIFIRVYIYILYRFTTHIFPDFGIRKRHDVHDRLTLHRVKTMRCNSQDKISVSAVFPAVSSGAKSLELRVAQVPRRTKGSPRACMLAQEVQIRLYESVELGKVEWWQVIAVDYKIGIFLLYLYEWEDYGEYYYHLF